MVHYVFNLSISPTLALLHFLLFFFNDTATTEIYTLSLHDALPISPETLLHSLARSRLNFDVDQKRAFIDRTDADEQVQLARSEEHTSELQSPDHLVCRLLLEKKKQTTSNSHIPNRYTAHYRPYAIV